MNATTKPEENTISSYITNPFKIIFTGLDWLFRYNQPIALVIIILGALSGFQGFLPGPSESNQTSSLDSSVAGSSSSIEPAAIVLIAVVAVSVIGFVLLIGSFINGFLSYVSYKTSRQEKTGFAEAFKATMDKIWQILGVTIIVGLKVLGGLLLFIIPGIRAAMRYQFAVMALFEADRKPKEAMLRSRELTKNRLMEVFGMMVSSSIIPFISTALQVGGQAVLFRQLVTYSKQPDKLPPVSKINYLLMLLPLGLLLLIVTIWAVIALALK